MRHLLSCSNCRWDSRWNSWRRLINSSERSRLHTRWSRSWRFGATRILCVLTGRRTPLSSFSLRTYRCKSRVITFRIQGIRLESLRTRGLWSLTRRCWPMIRAYSNSMCEIFLERTVSLVKAAFHLGLWTWWPGVMRNWGGYCYWALGITPLIHCMIHVLVRGHRCSSHWSTTEWIEFLTLHSDSGTAKTIRAIWGSNSCILFGVMTLNLFVQRLSTHAHLLLGGSCRRIVLRNSETTHWFHFGRLSSLFLYCFASRRGSWSLSWWWFSNVGNRALRFSTCRIWSRGSSSLWCCLPWHLLTRSSHCYSLCSGGCSCSNNSRIKLWLRRLWIIYRFLLNIVPLKLNLSFTLAFTGTMLTMTAGSLWFVLLATLASCPYLMDFGSSSVSIIDNHWALKYI